MAVLFGESCHSTKSRNGICLRRYSIAISSALARSCWRDWLIPHRSSMYLYLRWIISNNTGFKDGCREPTLLFNEKPLIGELQPCRRGRRGEPGSCRDAQGGFGGSARRFSRHQFLAARHRRTQAGPCCNTRGARSGRAALCLVDITQRG